MYDATLLFLLKGGHLNVPDRIARSLWPHPPLTLDAVTEYLAGVLESGERCFLANSNLHAPVKLSGRVVSLNGNLRTNTFTEAKLTTLFHQPR